MPDITTYYIDRYKRHLLTAHNLAELGITVAVVQDIQKISDLKVDGVVPDGLSINEEVFGIYSGQTAAKLGRMTYMDIGEPLIEERADIVQPPPDLLATRTFTNRNRADRHGFVRDFKDTVGFSVSNTVSWSLQGTGQLTFGGRTSAELEAQLQKSLQHSITQSKSHTDISHNHPKDRGGETRDKTELAMSDSETDTGSGTASGTGELFAQLMLGITGSVSGSVTTSWKSSSSVSGKILGDNRVTTMATQRRQVRQYIYELPITLAGYAVLHYPKPVAVSVDATKGFPVEMTGDLIPVNITKLGLYKDYRSKGIAETVSALDVEHTIFEQEALTAATATDSDVKIVRPHYL
ncbi:hypothetical protein [Nocardia sp. JCM 34519.1]|uniref:hypothetical protein n=1 Tax=Nocardia sp. JCM 34519.1 TaxID=2876119 RepID=UPI001CE47FFB|nr:hypothetical protein [Nocardia sp. JCM 34519.1]